MKLTKEEQDKKYIKKCLKLAEDLYAILTDGQSCGYDDYYSWILHTLDKKLYNKYKKEYK